MNITKVKYSGEKVRIEYTIERTDGGEADEYTLQSADKPLPSFETALLALTPDVVDICELDTLSAAHITVRGVTFTWKNDIMGACITALKTLATANAPLVLNTPHLPSESYSGSEHDRSPVFSRGTYDRLGHLITEAVRYIDGERAQANLPLEPVTLVLEKVS
jgi:hypothetical protein